MCTPRESKGEERIDLNVGTRPFLLYTKAKPKCAIVGACFHFASVLVSLRHSSYISTRIVLYSTSPMSNWS